MPASAKDPDFVKRSTSVATKVRRRFDALGWTQQHLIDETGISRGYVQALLNNRGSVERDAEGNFKPFNPTLDTVWKLAVALDLDLGYLIDPDIPVTDDPPRHRRRG